MSDVLQRNLWDSAFDFQRVVWPHVKEWLGGGDLLPVETAEGDLALALDTLAGIDAYRVVEEVGLQGIASRVQYRREYRTFTVRVSRRSGGATELQKRARAILDEPDAGFLFPAFTVQGYVTQRRTGRCTYVCAVRTADLTRYAVANQHRLRHYINPADGSRFLAVPVADLRAAGIEVFEWIRPAEPTEVMRFACFRCIEPWGEPRWSEVSGACDNCGNDVEEYSDIIYPEEWQ